MTQLEAIAKLRTLLKPGSKVYTILEHTSGSGMTRDIKLVISRKNDIYDIGWLAAYALGHKRQANGGLRVYGSGMDMGFSLVYNLGRTLWPKGFKLPKGVTGRNGDTSGFDTDGGYALTHNWL